MKTLLVTDIHGEIEKLEQILKKEEHDIVLCAGDLSDSKKYPEYEENLSKVLDVFDETGKLVKAVPGNMDPEETCVEKLVEYRMNLHKNIASFSDYETVGFGGGKTPFNTPFEPEGEEIKNVLSELYSRMKSETKIAVVHQPPKDTKLDKVENGEHVGSQEVRDLIKEENFQLMLTGHIHEARGKDEIDGTKIVNPGPVQQGYYATLNTAEGIEISLKQL